jgi:ribosomal protein L37AE/L43A
MNGDVVGFFNELGISLPTKKSGGNVRVRCFAQPEAHKHGDKTAAASVRLEDGVWNCFACSANGNAYEAAIAVGKTPAEAMALLERHGLSKPKPARAGRRSKTATMVPKKPATPSETKL